MTYDELVAFLERNWSKNPTTRPVDSYPFDELRAFLAERGDPQSGLTVLHVTGSKGKGSTTAMSAALLRAHGLRCGSFTSPHLLHVEERIQGGDGEPIDREELAARMSDLMAASLRAGHDPRSIWRLFMVAALEHWRDRGVAHAAIEVGVGGRFDPTNVLDGAVAAITAVGLEHVPRLGHSRSEIAAQKVAIVKPYRTCVCAPQSPDVEAVVRAGAALAGARLILLRDDALGPGYVVDRCDDTGIQADLRTPYRTLERTRIALLGRHQAENAAVALCGAEQILAEAGLPLEADRARDALGTVRWPARLDVLRRHPPLVYDGAHTPESGRVLARSLSEHFPGLRWTFVIGLSAPRDVPAILRELAPLAERVVGVPVPSPQAVDPGVIAASAFDVGLPAATARSVAEIVDRSSLVPTCIAGTLYLYGEVRKALALTTA